MHSCTAVIDPDGNSVAQVESLAALLGSMLSVVPNIYEKFGNTEVKRLANIIMKEKKEKK
jgi:N-methylhydantoinase B